MVVVVLIKPGVPHGPTRGCSGARSTRSGRSRKPRQCVRSWKHPSSCMPRGKDLLHVTTVEQARQWVQDYHQWCARWKDFLAEKTLSDNGWVYTHERLVRARNSMNRLISKGVLFTFVDPHWDHAMPAMNNQIEGATNAPLRQVLRDHQGMRLTRRIKAVFWWCYMHSEHPLPAAKIVKVMPTDKHIETAWATACQEHPITASIPRWGDAICWNELHHTTPYHNPWD